MDSPESKTKTPGVCSRPKICDPAINSAFHQLWIAKVADHNVTFGAVLQQPANCLNKSQPHRRGHKAPGATHVRRLPATRGSRVPATQPGYGLRENSRVPPNGVAVREHQVGWDRPSRPPQIAPDDRSQLPPDRNCHTHPSAGTARPVDSVLVHYTQNNVNGLILRNTAMTVAIYSHAFVSIECWASCKTRIAGNTCSRS